MIAEHECDSPSHIIRNRIGHDSRYWSKGRRDLSRMLDAIQRLSPGGELFTKDDLRGESGAALPATCDLLSKLEDYRIIETIRAVELRPNARDICPAPARYRLKPGADLAPFREIADAYDGGKTAHVG